MVIEVLDLILSSGETGEKREHDIPTYGGPQGQWKGDAGGAKLPNFSASYLHSPFQKWTSRVGIKGVRHTLRAHRAVNQTWEAPRSLTQTTQHSPPPPQP